MTIVVATVMLLWAALTIYTEIIDADPNEYSIKSPEVRQQLENCAGTFAQRQACAERITTGRQQLGFLVWCEKVVIILGPPLVLWGLAGYATRQRGRAPRPEPVSRRVAPAAAQRPRPRPRDTMGADARPGEPPPPTAAPGAHTEGAPLFTGGRREPVRRRDH